MTNDSPCADAALNRPKRNRRSVRRYAPKVGQSDGECQESTRKEPSTRRHTGKRNFKCADCSSPFVTNPAVRRNEKGPVRKSVPRRRIDPLTGEISPLCNACGLKWSRHLHGIQPREPPKMKTPITKELKDSLLADGSKFGTWLATVVLKSEKTLELSKKLFCSRLLKCAKPPFARLCPCIQNHVLGNPGISLTASLMQDLNLHEVSERAKTLAKITEDAGVLRCEVSAENSRKRSEKYEIYVRTWRVKLRQLKICETACQKLLMYSNNFLHKPLKRSSKRVEQFGSSDSKNWIPLTELPNEKCCGWLCTRLAVSHPNLVKRWRTDSIQGCQKKKREAVKLMSVPVAGGVKNCSNFIRMVTGVCYSTIARVQRELLEPSESKLSARKGKRRKAAKSPDRRYKQKVAHSPDSVSVTGLGDVQDKLPSFSSVMNAESEIVSSSRWNFDLPVNARISFVSPTENAETSDADIITDSEYIPLASLQPSVLEECPGVEVDANSCYRSADFSEYFQPAKKQAAVGPTSFVSFAQNVV